VDFSHVFDLGRWRARFRSDDAAAAAARAEGRVPDATPDEVGTPDAPLGFDGRPRARGSAGNGQGSGDVGGSGWAGWGA
jgi:hypothetical protein